MNDNPLILSLETATLGGSVFLGRGNRELASRAGHADVSHSNSLLSDINESLKTASISLPEIELFACASGPGSFTGLRIGIATLKALSATLNRPCLGIPTLHAVAHAAGPSSRTVALLPAGRGEVFAQMFSVSVADEVVALDEAAHLLPQRLLEKYGGHKRLHLAGTGAYVQREFLQKYAESHGIAFNEDGAIVDPVLKRTGWYLAPSQRHLARNVAALAVRSFQKGDVQSPRDLHAIYVRPSDAELKEQCR
ncbi:MAG: tRNA (adenosine(37)-N6)-threonylcarbamoyltransferase complex dimerization subunit type 1 TsaB [Pyrinomonadaceae bacterium]